MLTFNRSHQCAKLLLSSVRLKGPALKSTSTSQEINNTPVPEPNVTDEGDRPLGHYHYTRTARDINSRRKISIISACLIIFYCVLRGRLKCMCLAAQDLVLPSWCSQVGTTVYVSLAVNQALGRSGPNPESLGLRCNNLPREDII